MTNPLPLFGDIPKPAPRKRIPLISKGFRPFFLVGAAFAALILPLWMFTLANRFHPVGYLDALSWHGHEMVFGYSVAILAGFLLTAVGNWTQRETLVGAPLVAFAALWLAGRVSMTFSLPLARWVLAVVDLAFLPLLIAVLARPMIASRNKRNFVIVGLLSALFLANLAVHLDVLGVIEGFRHRSLLLGVDVVVLVILIISGRVFPMFTRNATEVASIRSHPLLDGLAVAGMALIVIQDATHPDPRWLAFLSGIVGILAAARSVHWGAQYSMGTPLLWILHVGYLWIPIGLWLRGVSAVTARVPASIAMHALTVGAIGALTMGMMARVALGHTGRLLTVPKSVTLAFVLVTLAACVRVTAPLFDPIRYRITLFVAGTLWSAAFLVFLAVYTPILLSPRVDGKPG